MDRAGMVVYGYGNGTAAEMVTDSILILAMIGR